MLKNVPDEKKWRRYPNNLEIGNYKWEEATRKEISTQNKLCLVMCTVQTGKMVALGGNKSSTFRHTGEYLVQMF